MDFSNDKLITIPRPELGRPVDPRVTPEYIASRPALQKAGYPAFDPERDIDVHGYIEGALQWLHAQVQYANPELGGQLTSLKGELEKALADAVQQQDDLDARQDANDAASQAAVANANAAAQNIAGSSGINLAYDALNFIAAAQSGAVTLPGPNSSETVTPIPVGDATNPYTHPILRAKNGGGRFYLVSDLGKAGEQITVSVKALTASATANISWIFRQTSAVGASVGTGTSALIGTGGEKTVSFTMTIPANAYVLEVRANGLTTSETLDIVAVGIAKGALARPILEDSAPRSELLDKTPGVNLAYDAYNRTVNALGITAAANAGHLINTSGMSLLAANTGNNPYPHPALVTTGSGGRRWTLAELGLKAGDTVTGVMDVHHATGANGVGAALIFRSSAGGALGDVAVARVRVQGAVLLSATKVIPEGAVTLELYPVRDASTGDVVLRRFGIFLGKKIYALTEDAARGEDQRSSTRRIAALESTVTTPKIETSLAVSGTFTPTIADQTGKGVAQYSSPTGATGTFTVWGRSFSGVGQTNVIGFVPPHPITGQGELIVRATELAGSAVLARSQYPIAAKEWNAAAAAGAELKVPLSATVTGNWVLVHHAFGEKLGYVDGGNGTGAVAQRWYLTATSGDYGTLALTNGGTALAPYYKLYYSPDLAIKRYADAAPGSGTGGGSSIDSVLAAAFGTPDIYLPSEMYVLKRDGEQFTLYDRGLVPGGWHKTGTLEYDGTYGKQIGASAGAENSGWRIEPNGVGAGYAAPLGSFTMTASIRDWSWRTIVSKSSKVYVIDPAAKQSPVRVLVTGDSNTYKDQYTARIAALGNVTFTGTRKLLNGRYGEGQGGWKLISSDPNSGAGGYVNGGNLNGMDSPFAFPVGVAATDYRGNTKFWAMARAVDAGTNTNNTDVYNFAGFGRKLREGNDAGAVLYDANGYPTNPQTGWVVFDPAQAAGARFRTWDGAAWVAMATQPASWEISPLKYTQRFAWAFNEGLPTHVTIMLGTNDYSSTLPDPSEFPVFLAEFDKLVNGWHAVDPNIVVIPMLPTMPAVQDGEGDSYGAGIFGERMRAAYQRLYRAMIDKYDTAAKRTEKTYLSHFGAGVDPTFGYEPLATATGAAGEGAEPVHKYAPYHLVRRVKNGIHPTTTGASQGGDWAAATIQYTRA